MRRGYAPVQWQAVTDIISVLSLSSIWRIVFSR